MNRPSALTLARWLCAAAAGLGGWFLLARVTNTGSGWTEVFGKSLFGIAGLLTGVLLLSPELVGWAVLPLHRLLDTILLPSESEPPPADYHLARFYHQQARHEEACAEYLKIVRYHPEQTAAYLEGITAAMLAGDDEAARKLYRQGSRALRSADDRRLLTGVYESRHALLPLEEGADSEAENPELNHPAQQADEA